MSDQPVQATPIPALPSRAAQTPPTTTRTIEQVVNDAITDAGKPKRQRSKRSAIKLSKAMIATIKAKRAAALAAKQKPRKLKPAKAVPVRRRRRKPRNDKHAIEPQRVSTVQGRLVGKNPNRPLEMKNQLAAVLEYSTQMTRPELTLFATTMKAMQELSRGSRRRVIAALAQVYP